MSLDSVADTPEVVAAFTFLVESGANANVALLACNKSVLPKEFNRLGDSSSLVTAIVFLRG